MKWYLIRLTTQDCTRIEKARGPREACKLAFGVIYDRGQAVFKQINTPRRMPQKVREKVYGSEGWLPIPAEGA